LNKEKRIFSRDWSLYDGQHVVFHPKLLSPKQLQVNIISAYCRYYSLYHSLKLMLQMSFRNAMFRLMGYKIIRDWKTRNRLLKWLVPAKICG
jgi:hypothetical protein